MKLDFNIDEIINNINKQDKRLNSSLIDLVSYLYNKYFNTTDPIIILEKTPRGKKIEMGYIDNIIMHSIKENLNHFEILTLFGDSKIKDKVEKIKFLVNEYNPKELEDKKLKLFIESWKIDLDEIDLLTLKLLTNFIK